MKIGKLKAFEYLALVALLLIFASMAFAAEERVDTYGNIYSSDQGRVGIGNIKPAFKLDVNGSVRVHGGGFVLSSGTDPAWSFMKTYGNYNWGYNILFNPGAELIIGAGESAHQLTNDGDASGGSENLHLSADGSIFLWSGAQGGNQTRAVTINSTGNIGIGTDTPMKKLHIRDASVIFDAGFGGNNVQYTYGNRTYRYAFEGNGYNLLFKGRNSSPVLGFDRINGDVGNPQPLSDNDEIFQIRSSGTNANGTQTAHVALRVNVDGAANGDGLNQKLGLLDNKVVIRHSGNVGIGNTDPDHKLVVGPAGGGRHLVINDIPQARWGLVTGQYALRIQNDWGNSWTSRMMISKEGNVGIGTTSPHTKLDVNGVTRSKFSIVSAGNTTEGGQLTLADGGQYDLTGESANAWNIDVFNSRLRFHRSSSGEKMTITDGGNVGIGTTNPKSTLAVNGTITAKEIKVESGWSDFVFDEGYDLASLDEIESFVRKNKHLPDIPSAKEVEQKGLAVSEMLAKQMQKIEEMTLYLIELKKENNLLKATIADQDEQLASLKDLRVRIEALEQSNYVAIAPIARQAQQRLVDQIN